VTVSILKFRIVVLVSNQIEYRSNYSIRNFEYSHSTNPLPILSPCCQILAVFKSRMRRLYAVQEVCYGKFFFDRLTLFFIRLCSVDVYFLTKLRYAADVF